MFIAYVSADGHNVARVRSNKIVGVDNATVLNKLPELSAMNNLKQTVINGAFFQYKFTADMLVVKVIVIGYNIPY